MLKGWSGIRPMGDCLSATDDKSLKKKFFKCFH